MSDTRFVNAHTHRYSGLAHHESPGLIEGSLDSLGALPPGSILAHGVHLNEAPVRRAEQLGCWLVQNPRSNRGNRVGYPAAPRCSKARRGWATMARPRRGGRRRATRCSPSASEGWPPRRVRHPISTSMRSGQRLPTKPCSSGREWRTYDP